VIAGLALAVSLAAPAAGPTLPALLAREWDVQMQRNAVWASLLGDERFASRWDELAPETLAREAARDRAQLREWDAVDRASLSADDRLTLDLARRATAESVEAWERGAPLLWMSHQQGLPEGLGHPPGVHALEQLGPNLAFDDLADYEAWVARLRGVPDYVAQATALLRAGIRAGRLHPQVVVDRSLDILNTQLTAQARQSGFFEPFTRFPGRVAPAERARLTAEGEALVTTAVLPALRRFREFLAGEYRSAAPAEGGLARQNGAQLYAFLARAHTTTSLSPAEIHQIGLREVARLRAEMETVKAAAGFQGSMPEFFNLLRTDARFFHKDPQTLLTAYRALAKTIDPRLVRLFGRLPRQPYGVEPTPEATAPHATTGFYFPGAPDGSRPGTYIVNLYRPEMRPTWEMLPLTLHEAVPGHHLQVSLAAEGQELPAFRRLGYFTAFGEGWGLYSEWLGYELGLYADPYDRFGQLTWEMWRAVRLVIDTGMHSEGWTRERATSYFKENSPRPELDIENEVDRYLAAPGQALAYKIGQLKILELRRRAEQALGPRFEVRAFHDEVLGAGSLPLDALEARIDAWIAGVASATP
jgi:uncharacterized protein (DUF885 family)